MGAGGALGCVSPGGVAERDGGGARDHLGEAAEADARCACDAGARAQAGDCRAEGAAGGTCAEEKLIMPPAGLDSRRALVSSQGIGARRHSETLPDLQATQTPSQQFSLAYGLRSCAI
jgi:hypothetical protein